MRKGVGLGILFFVFKFKLDRVLIFNTIRIMLQLFYGIYLPMIYFYRGVCTVLAMLVYMYLLSGASAKG